MAAVAAADAARGGGGNSSGGRQRRRRQQRERAAGAQRERMYVFFYKFISYVAFYVGPIQTGFLMAFLARFRRKSNRDSCSKQATGMEKNRNPEDSCRNGQPGLPESDGMHNQAKELVAGFNLDSLV
jgi:hypothetical protein